MRSRNIKCNSSLSGKVGSVSCLLFLLLTFLVVNPMVSSSVFAEELNKDYNDVLNDDLAAVADDILGTYADTPSTVGISFSPARYYAELAPTNSAGQSARIDLSTTIYVYSSGGYSVYLKSDSPNLVGEKDSNSFIPGATTARTYTNMSVNTWGYASAVDAIAVPDNATYKAVTSSGNGTKLAENTDNDIKAETRTIALSFATKINDQMAADTYSNTMTLSVVSSPMRVVSPEIAYDFGGITNMQQMTTAICAAAPAGGVKQLKDTRDGKYYWIGKLDDGKCWMTQNLDLDLSTSTTLTTANSDVPSAGYKPAYTTATTVDSSTILADDTGQRSWSLGNYRITNPNVSNSCGSKKADFAACATKTATNDRFTPYTTPTTANGDVDAHYIVGNQYQWNTATAGTGSTITSGQATNSICPKGWRLPTSDSGGEFEALVMALGGTSTPNNVTKAPFYGVRGGYVQQDIDYLLRDAGSSGHYWSSTPYSSRTNVYSLTFSGTSVNPSLNGLLGRRVGDSVRCVAR